MSRKNRSPEKKPVEQRSVNCCRWRTSTAWTTSRTCSREPLPNLWRMVWRPNWMRILVTANTTIRTKLRTTAGTATAAKICEPVLAMSRFLFPVTGKDVLGDRTEWSEESGRRGYFYRMYRQFDWFRYSHPCSVPGNGDSELHDSPAAEFQQIRFLQRPEGSHVRSESRVCSSGRTGCSGRFGNFCAELGQ